MTRYNLRGRTVVITGGAGGLATYLAPALRDRGAKVALLDLDREQVEATASGIAKGGSVRGWQSDVRNLAELEDTMNQVASHFGSIDVVIANAGLGDSPTLLAEDDPARWDLMVDVNLSGVYRTFRAAYPHIAQTKGYMLATSSMAAFVHGPLQGAYPATKAGVWALCDTWRLEVRHLGIGVGSLHPTFFQTPMMESIWADPAGDRLWGGNRRGMWKAVAPDVVVREAIRGIERRAAHITAPRTLAFSALVPGLAQKAADRFGFPGGTIPEAAALIANGGQKHG
jgi:NAD(P)-dependent dehydrogenase (short-subunit alcohol dehydrogenase family)